MLHLGWAKFLLLCALISLVSTQDDKGPSDSVSWMVQISDLHVSKYNKSPIEADLKLLAEQVLSLIKPAKLLLTGDLVDAKTKHGGSKQHAAEWKAYQALWQHVVQAVGLTAEDILDVRGNHDTFNTIATQQSDYFMVHSARAAVSRDAAAARSHVHLLPARVELPAGGASAAEGGQDCPSGLLLGVQTTPIVGLKGPTNFMGIMRPEDVADVDHQLSLAVNSLHSRGCSAPIIAYGHHPLSTIHYPGPRSPPTTPRPTLPGKLAAFDVAAYLCGHLHNVFGDRLHRLHYKPSGALLAELEAADWKVARNFRVLAIDSGVLSFADLRFSRPPGGEAQAQVAPLDESLVITQHLVLMTYPPPATYSPLTSLQLQRQYRTVRCLVLPMRGLHAPPPHTAGGRPTPAKVASVLLSWSCGGERGAAPMQQVKHGRPVYEAGDLEGVLQCRHPVQLQVTVTDAQGGRSLSEARVVQVAAQGGGFTPMADPDGDPNAGFTWLERFMLGTYWPEFSRAMFATLWGVHFWCMLLVPRFLGPTLLAILTPPRSLSPLGSSPLALLLALAQWVWGLLLWPLQVLVRLSMQRTAWACLVIFSLNLHWGPWFLGSFFMSAPIGIFTAQGLYHAAPDPSSPDGTPGPFTLDPQPDVRIATVLHLVTCLLPATLWIAAVVARWADHAAEGTLSPPPGPLGLSWLQVVGLMPIAWVNWKMLGRLSSAYGAVALLTSPPYAWLPLLVLLLLWHVRRRLAAGRVLMPCRSLPKPID